MNAARKTNCLASSGAQRSAAVPVSRREHYSVPPLYGGGIGA
jgi:hypothetical protein